MSEIPVGLYTVLQHVHGHLAVLGLAVLLHPVLRLGKRPLTRGTRWTLAATLALVCLTYAGGWLAYPTYRHAVKPGLVADHRGWALAFESKEHLAWFCLALTTAGVGLAWTSRTPVHRRAAQVLLGLAWLAGAVVVALGVGVAATAHPAW